VGPAALPLRAGQRGADRGHETAVGVGDDQADTGQPARGQRAQEGEPAGAVLIGGDVEAEDLAAAVGVDADRDQGVHVDRAAVLADLDDQRVGPHERVRTGVQWPVAERLDLGVQVPGHLRHLRLRQRLDAELLDQLLHPPRRHAEQIAGGHHRDQRLFGPAAVLQHPVREVRPGPQLRDGQVDGAGPGVPLAVAIAVTRVGPFAGALAVTGAAQGIGLGRHQRVRERLDQGLQDIRARRSQMRAQQTGKVQTLCYGHRRSLLRDLDNPKDLRWPPLSSRKVRVIHHFGGRDLPLSDQSHGRPPPG
jgi:hypothetical protein